METIKGRSHDPTGMGEALAGVTPIGKLVPWVFAGDGASMYLHGHQTHVEFVHTVVEPPHVCAQLRDVLLQLPTKTGNVLLHLNP